MRSSSSLDRLAVALGAATQGVWCGVLAAAVTGASWPLPAAFAAAVIAAAAAITHSATSEESRLPRGRRLIAALVVLSAAVLLTAGRAWTHDLLLWQLIRDLAFVVALVLLGVYLDRGGTAPEGAVRRALRAFGLVCALLVITSLDDAPLAHAGAAVAAVIVLGALHVVLARHIDLSETTQAGDRLPVWPWMLAVAGIVGAVLIVAGLLGPLAGDEGPRRLLGAAWAVVAYFAQGIAYVFGWAGAGVLRSLSWLAGLVNLHLSPPKLPQQRPSLALPAQTPQPVAPLPAAVRPLVIVAAAAAAIAVAAAAVGVSLRLLRRSGPGDRRVAEERENLRSLSSVARSVVAGWPHRLRGVVGLRRRALTPSEQIRRRYEALERRLSRAGRPRTPGMTVRAYLAACAAAAGDGPEPGGDGAVRLSGLYEAARYSAQTIEPAQAERFDELARSLSEAMRAFRTSG